MNLFLKSLLGVKKKKRMKHLKKIFMNIIIEIETILENIFNQMKYVYWEKRTIYIGKSFERLDQEEKVLLEQEVM